MKSVIWIRGCSEKIFGVKSEHPDTADVTGLDERLKKIRSRYIERGSYFVINRGRQYGKTTTLKALAEYLRPDYIVLSMDFQEIGTAEFQDEAVFSRAFVEVLMKAYRYNGMDYRGEQFIVELKIWHGNEYNERGEEQLLDYLDYYRIREGYMLSFNFNKKKETGVKEVRMGDKTIVEAVV